MFELVNVLGSPSRTIRLDTRLGTSVANAQSCSPDSRTESIFNHIVSKHSQWVKRKKSCGTYNCFGHVWASRRTCIYESGEINKILSEDGYRNIDENVATRGDVALYLTEDNKTIWHAGIIEPRQMVNTNVTVLWVLSKLNDIMGEVFHQINDVHAPFPYEIQIWTDRVIEE